jgi:integrase
MTTNKLSALKIKALTTTGRYGDGGGLWLQVRDADRRSWLFRYKQHGRSHWMGLGPLDLVTLAAAREKARDCRRLLLDGLDPLTKKRADNAALSPGQTFRDVAGLYIAAHEAGWRNPVHRAQWRSTLDSYVYPIFGSLPVAAVATGDVMRALEPIWREKAETASRLRGRVESVLDYATARGWRSGDNPARWRGHLANLLPARSAISRVEHHAALPFTDIKAFMVALRQQQGTAALALQFTILTASRTGETIGAKWSEFSGAIWTVPAERMKAHVEHRVPLSPAAVAILESMAPLRPATGDSFLFPGRKADSGLSNMALIAVLRRMNRGDLTTHGFRSTFRDWIGETTGYPREVAETALAHTLRDKVEAAYRRGDLFAKRVELMSEWATYIASQ